PVRVDPPIAQERPVGPAHIHLAEIAGGREHFVALSALHEYSAAGVRHEAATPELDAPLRVALMADPIHGAHVDPIGNGVTSLHRFPRRLLLRAVLLFF